MSRYQELILWAGLGIVVIMLLTNTSVHTLLFSGGNQAPGSSSKTGTAGSGSKTGATASGSATANAYGATERALRAGNLLKLPVDATTTVGDAFAQIGKLLGL